MQKTYTYLVPGALAVAVLLGAVGGSSLNAVQVRAADTTQTTVTGNSTPDQRGTLDPSKGGHIGANGKHEELLTGDTAEKVKAAALKAVPGGTIERVETDAEGAAYEAHMRGSDGSHVTVKVDSSFTVTDTEDGPQR